MTLKMNKNFSNGHNKAMRYNKDSGLQTSPEYKSSPRDYHASPKRQQQQQQQKSYNHTRRTTLRQDSCNSNPSVDTMSFTATTPQETIITDVKPKDEPIQQQQPQDDVQQQQHVTYHYAQQQQQPYYIAHQPYQHPYYSEEYQQQLQQYYYYHQAANSQDMSFSPPTTSVLSTPSTSSSSSSSYQTPSPPMYLAYDGTSSPYGYYYQQQQQQQHQLYSSSPSPSTTVPTEQPLSVDTSSNMTSAYPYMQHQHLPYPSPLMCYPTPSPLSTASPSSSSTYSTTSAHIPYEQYQTTTPIGIPQQQQQQTQQSYSAFVTPSTNNNQRATYQRQYYSHSKLGKRAIAKSYGTNTPATTVKSNSVDNEQQQEALLSSDMVSEETRYGASPLVQYNNYYTNTSAMVDQNTYQTQFLSQFGACPNSYGGGLAGLQYTESYGYEYDGSGQSAEWKRMMQVVDCLTDKDLDNFDEEAESHNLACDICRGRNMCFCYFLKVGYFKFPSFNDLVEYSYRKWRREEAAKRRMGAV